MHGRLKGWLEARGLIVLAVLSGILWGVLKLAGEVAEGEMDAFDLKLLLSLRNPLDPGDPLGPPAVEEAIRDISALGGFAIVSIVTVAAAVIFALNRRWRHGMILAFIVCLASAGVEIVKTMIDRPRPELIAHGVHVFSSSFPSGHTTIGSATYLTLAILIARLDIRPIVKRLILAGAIVLSVAIGFSRVYLGVHWPTDVAAGLSLGSALALLAWILAGLVDRRAAPASDG